MELTEFLQARIAEDEAVAREAHDGPWESDDDQVLLALIPATARTRARHAEWLCDTMSDGNAAHIARHDPARVLAQAGAVRRIVEMRYSWNLEAERHPEPPFGPIFDAKVSTADAILRALASIWRDHPDFDPAWA